MLPPSVTRLIELALEEDVGRGDLTSEACLDADQQGAARVVARHALRACGTDVAATVFRRVDPRIECTDAAPDGAARKQGDVLLGVQGPARSILLAERLALNFLGRLCGVATHAARYRKVLDAAGAPSGVRVVDTRKTTPGWRVLEKRAVRAGGLANHRMDLASGVLIKDNHIAACGRVDAAVRQARKSAMTPHTAAIQVEVESAEQIRDALEAGADALLIDNRSPEELAELVRLARERARELGRPVVLEASGGVSLESLARFAVTGVDVLSAGDLTHGATWADVALDWT